MPTQNEDKFTLAEELRRRLEEDTPLRPEALWRAYWGEEKGSVKLIHMLAWDLLQADHSRAILVHGSYGTGKTAFLNLLQQRLRQLVPNLPGFENQTRHLYCLWLHMPVLTSSIQTSAMAAVMGAIVHFISENTTCSEDQRDHLFSALDDLWRMEADICMSSRDADPCTPHSVAPRPTRMAGFSEGTRSTRVYRANTLELLIDTTLGWSARPVCQEAGGATQKGSERTEGDPPPNDRGAASLGHKLVVFLDDLDRCEKRVAKDVVRLLLRFGPTRGVHFVLASDWEVLNHGVQAWMTDHGSTAQGEPLVVANSALGKYIHHQVDLPSLGHQLVSTACCEKDVPDGWRPLMLADCLLNTLLDGIDISQV